MTFERSTTWMVILLFGAPLLGLALSIIVPALRRFL